MNAIHPTAIIHPGAALGANVRIGPHVIIEDDVRIGDGTYIESGNRIGTGARIGSGCSIMHGAVIAGPPVDGAPDGGSTVTIGDHTIVREFTTVDRGATAAESTHIGARCLLMACSHVDAGCTFGDTVIIANGCRIGTNVRIGDFAIVGGMCAIEASVRIGTHSMIGGSCVIDRDVPPYVLAGRDPLVFEGLNLVGLRRRSFDSATIRSIDTAYSILYAGMENPGGAIARIRAELPPSPEIGHVVSFFSTSVNGIIDKHRS